MIHSKPKVFQSQQQLSRAITTLRQRCEVMHALHQAVGTPQLRKYETGFNGLARIVVGQQLSIASAAAIWSRVSPKTSPLTADKVASLSDTELAAMGLSRPKIRTLRTITQAILNNEIRFQDLDNAPDEFITSELAKLHGVGPWTANIYLLFALRRRDAFPANDLALQIAAGLAFSLPARPSDRELVELAEKWRPYRGAAALQLWAAYTHLKRT